MYLLTLNKYSIILYNRFCIKSSKKSHFKIYHFFHCKVLTKQNLYSIISNVRLNIGISPSGKARGSDPRISEVRILLSQPIKASPFQVVLFYFKGRMRTSGRKLSRKGNLHSSPMVRCWNPSIPANKKHHLFRWCSFIF